MEEKGKEERVGWWKSVKREGGGGGFYGDIGWLEKESGWRRMVRWLLEIRVLGRDGRSEMTTVRFAIIGSFPFVLFYMVSG